MTEQDEKSINKTVDWNNLIDPSDEELSDKNILDLLGRDEIEISAKIKTDYGPDKKLKEGSSDYREIEYRELLEHLAQPEPKNNSDLEQMYNNMLTYIMQKEGHTFSEPTKTLLEEKEAQVKDKNENTDINKELNFNIDYLEQEFEVLTSEEEAVITQLEKESIKNTEQKPESTASTPIKPKRKFEAIEPDLSLSVAESVMKRRKQQRENSALQGRVI